MQSTKHSPLTHISTKIIFGFVLGGICLGGVWFVSLFNNSQPQIAQANRDKNILTKNYQLFQSISNTNISYLSDLREQYDTISNISSENANQIDTIGNQLRNQLALYQKQEHEFEKSEQEDIDTFTQAMKTHLDLQEVYIRNAIETVVYFTCMVEKKSQFNVNWQVFEAEFSDTYTPTIDSITSEKSRNYFTSFAQTARKSAETLQTFNFCFEDTFYTYKDKSFDAIIKKSEDDLQYVASLFDNFASLITQQNAEEKLIATIELIESVDLKNVQLIKSDFDSLYIVTPTKKVFDETVAFTFIPKSKELDNTYNSLLQQW